MDSAAEARFAQWASARARPMQRLAYFLCGDWQLSEDLVQEAFVSCARHWRRLERVENPDAYVRKALINQCRSHWRRGSTRHDRLGVSADVAVVDHSQRHADRDELLLALRNLPARQRAAVVLRYYEELSEAETADVLGCSVGTVKSQTHKALASMRAMITKEGQPC